MENNDQLKPLSFETEEALNHYLLIFKMTSKRILSLLPKPFPMISEIRTAILSFSLVLQNQENL